MQFIPPDRQQTFVHELTDRVLARFFEERGIEGGVEYSWVLHQRASESLQSPGLADPHTHVVLPGTYYDEGKGQRMNLYFSQNRKERHIDLLHRTAEAVMVEQMERYVGRDWEQRFDAIEMERQRERDAISGLPETLLVDKRQQYWGAWIGTRRTDERTSAVGLYRAPLLSPHKPDMTCLQFIPLVHRLKCDYGGPTAERLREWLRDHPDEGIEGLTDLAERIHTMSNEEAHEFLSRQAPSQMESYRPRQQDIDIGFWW
jgi:hypothetical protein